jgi:hypothetical protein
MSFPEAGLAMSPAMASLMAALRSWSLPPGVRA